MLDPQGDTSFPLQTRGTLRTGTGRLLEMEGCVRNAVFWRQHSQRNHDHTVVVATGTRPTRVCANMCTRIHTHTTGNMKVFMRLVKENDACRNEKE